MTTTAPTFEFHLTFTDVTEAEALMRHLETAQQQRSVELDIRDGVVSVTLTPPQPAAELPKWNWALPEDDAAGTFREGVSLSMFRSCRLCGCTDSAACLGGCSWVEADLCSACCDRLATAARVEVADGVDAVAFAGDPLEHQVGQPVWPPTGTVERDDRTPLALFHALVDEAVAAQLLEAPAPGFVTASWSTAFFEFEGMSARRIAFAAVELLAGASVPGIDELIGRYVPALEAALAAPVPAQLSEEDLADIAALEGVTVEEARRVVDGEPELHVTIEADDSAARAAFGGDTAATDTPQDDAEPDEDEALVDDDQEATDAGGSGDAGPREDPEGSSSGPGTSPDPPATFTPSPGPLTDQVVELLNAYPEVTFRPGDVDDALDIGDTTQAANKLGELARTGRIQKIDRGLYRALDQAQSAGDDSGARERIVRWLTDNEKGSTTRIAAGTGLAHSAVVDELRRMSDAGVARVAHGGWVLRTDHDTAELIEQRRLASVQGM